MDRRATMAALLLLPLRRASSAERSSVERCRVIAGECTIIDLILARDDRVNDQQEENRARNQQIAANEEKREHASDIRLSTWAIGLAVVFALAVAMFMLMKK